MQSLASNSFPGVIPITKTKQANVRQNREKEQVINENEDKFSKFMVWGGSNANLRK